MNRAKLHEEQARNLVAEAEKKMSPKGFFQSLFGGGKGNRTEEAIEIYHKAGNLFKMAQNWLEAGSVFRIAADLNNLQHNRSEAANSFVLASKCFEKYDHSSAVNCLLSAIQIYTDLGRFVQAAKLHNSIAEIYEHALDIENAVQHFEQAADYYKVEENHAYAKKCSLKVAHYCAVEFEDYRRAIQIYEEVAFADLKNTLLQYSAKENLFRAVLCHLCQDVVSAKHTLSMYVDRSPAFEGSRECKLLRNIIVSMEECDVDAFTRIVREYDHLSLLEPWYTKMLLRIKKQIKEFPDLM